MKPIKQRNKSHKDRQKDLKQKLNMFDRLPEQCLTCNKPFDRKDREQVMTWFVVVKKELEKVHLYCPVCWDKATKLIQELMEKNNGTVSSDV